MNKLVIISYLPDQTHYFSYGMGEHESSDLVVKTVDNTEAAAEHIAKLMAEWGERSDQVHVIAPNWHSLVLLGDPCNGGLPTAYSPVNGVSMCVRTPSMFVDYNAADWEAQKAAEEEVCAVEEEVERLVKAKFEQAREAKRAAEERVQAEKWAKQMAEARERKLKQLAELKAEFESDQRSP